MGATLSKTFNLSWLGEFHANVLIDQARLAYYIMHGSASFVDKTPGVPMIRSAPFLADCFQDAKFICLRRNGISNVL